MIELGAWRGGRGRRSSGRRSHDGKAQHGPDPIHDPASPDIRRCNWTDFKHIAKWLDQESIPRSVDSFVWAGDVNLLTLSRGHNQVN
jgi:hypothetical protein